MANYHTLAQELIKIAANFRPMDTKQAAALEELATYLKEKVTKSQKIQLNFICTHNSRRSQLAQIMSQVLAAYFKLENFASFSGGTEVTVFHPNAVQALRHLGVDIQLVEQGDNPRYLITTGNLKSIAFSKHWNHPDNPKENFAAILVCDTAEANCPYVAGCEKRISLPWEDPKKWDGTPLEAEAYQKQALEIGVQLAWAFQKALATTLS